MGAIWNVWQVHRDPDFLHVVRKRENGTALHFLSVSLDKMKTNLLQQTIKRHSMFTLSSLKQLIDRWKMDCDGIWNARHLHRDSAFFIFSGLGSSVRSWHQSWAQSGLCDRYTEIQIFYMLWGKGKMERHSIFFLSHLKKRKPTCFSKK